MLKLVLAFHDHAARALQLGFPLKRLLAPEITSELSCMKEWPAGEVAARAGALLERIGYPAGDADHAR